MKKIYPLLLAFVLLFASITPTQAAGKGKTSFNLAGKIVGIGAGTVAVQVSSGNPAVKAYLGQVITLTGTTSTRYILSSGTPITFADLKIGDSVSSSGTLSAGTWTATRITVGAKLLH